MVSVTIISTAKLRQLSALLMPTSGTATFDRNVSISLLTSGSAFCNKALYRLSMSIERWVATFCTRMTVHSSCFH